MSSRLRAEARRESIIAAAARLFSERGFRGVTTRELADAVGVTEPVLYEHFQNKQEIYGAVFDRMFARAVEDLNSLMGQPAQTVSTRDFLIRVAAAISAWFRNEPEHVRLVLFDALERKEPSRKAYHDVREKFLGTLAGFLAARQNEPKTNPALPLEAMAHTFLCMVVHDALMQILFQHEPPDPEQSIEHMVDIFLHGVETR